MLKRAFDFKRIDNTLWYIPLLLLYPGIVILSYFILIAASAVIPAAQYVPQSVLFLSIGFFIGGLGEELGWAGYAADPLQNKLGKVKAGLLIGCVWAVWHWIPLIQVHRSVIWIMWWTLATISLRVIMMWLFNHTGKSVAGMALFHMTINLAWQLFPVAGSHFDIRLVALLVSAVAVAVVIGEGLKRHPSF